MLFGIDMMHNNHVGCLVVMLIVAYSVYDEHYGHYAIGDLANAQNVDYGTMQELLSWKFYNFNPDDMTYANTIRVMEGPSGHSLKFNVGDFVKIDSSSEGQAQDLLVSAWIKPDYNNTSQQSTV